MEIRPVVLRAARLSRMLCGKSFVRLCRSGLLSKSETRRRTSEMLWAQGLVAGEVDQAAPPVAVAAAQ